MSHHSTPHLHNKRTPGIVSETPGVNLAVGDLDHRGNHPQGPIVMDASRSVSDTTAANAKQLLNAYICDFLVKNALPQTAKCFVSEADIPSVVNDLSHLSKTSPHLVSNLGLLDKDVGGLGGTTPQTPSLAVNQMSITCPISLC